MKLPRRSLSPDEVVAEFDQWVTPSLGDVRSTQKFRSERERLAGFIEGVAGRIADGSAVTEALSCVLEEALVEEDSAAAEERLGAAIGSIFLATAKSDNAIKCQYPLHFRKTVGDVYPAIRRGLVVAGRAPDVIKAVDLITLAVRLRSIDAARAKRLVVDYAAFLLFDDQDIRQFRALVESYAHAEETSGIDGRDLFAPLVAFQVRGSVAASGGHDPENIVRAYLGEWGLEVGSHFNKTDATASDLNNWLVTHDTQSTRTTMPAATDKTRAFDFILPFQTVAQHQRVFIQSQFYAGDSGSVSHKNVDQASKARERAVILFPDARFVELVDGAGYCASLRKDLRHLLFASDTDDFVQLRSIPVRLRRILQESGVLSPLEVALTVEAVGPQRSAIETDLRATAPAADISSSVDIAIDRGWIEVKSASELRVAQEREGTVAKYRLLDEIVAASAPLDASDANGAVLVPGYGPNYGAELQDNWDVTVLESLARSGAVMMEGS